MSNPIAEIVTFRLIPGTERAAFLAAAAQTQSFVANAGGFLTRALSEAEDGTWTDHVLWTDMAAAKSAGDAFMASADTQDLMALIDPDSVRMSHQNTGLVMRSA
jgi:cytochrome c556